MTIITLKMGSFLKEKFSVFSVIESTVFSSFAYFYVDIKVQKSLVYSGRLGQRIIITIGK